MSLLSTMHAIKGVLAILSLVSYSHCASPTDSITRFANSTSSVLLAGTIQTPNRSASAAESTITAPVNISHNGAAYASNCNLASVSWSVANASWYSAHSPTSDCSSIFTATTYTGTSSDINPPYTTLCDGHARLPKDWEWPTYTNVSSVLDTTSCPPLKAIPTFTEPTPSCSVPASYCTQFWSEFVTNGGYMYAGTQNPVPQCSTSSNFYPGCEKCYISAYELQLYYWPVTTTGADSCYMSGTTVTAKPTGDGPNTRVVDGFTMTSPSVYLAFMNIAASAANMSCGPEITSTTIAMDPTDVYSLSRPPVACVGTGAPGCSINTAAATKVNFADFNWPVPFSAYKDMGQCSEVEGQDTCHNMTLPLMPELALPTWLPDVFPAWKNCKPMPTGVYDPPWALQAVTAIQGPQMTLSGPSTSTFVSADPSKTVDPPFATSTVTTTALEDQQGTSSGDVSSQSTSQVLDPPKSTQTSDDASTVSTMQTTTTVFPASPTETSVSSSVPPSQIPPPPVSTQAPSSSTSTGGLGGWIFSALGGKLSTTEIVIVSTSHGAEISATSTIIVAESPDTAPASPVGASGSESPTAGLNGDPTSIMIVAQSPGTAPASPVRTSGSDTSTAVINGDPTEAKEPTSTVTGFGGIIASLVAQLPASTSDAISQTSHTVMTLAVATPYDLPSLIPVIMHSTASSSSDESIEIATRSADPVATTPANVSPHHEESTFEIVGPSTTYNIVIASSSIAGIDDVLSATSSTASISGGNPVHTVQIVPSSEGVTTSSPTPASIVLGTDGTVSATIETYTLDSSQVSALFSAMSLDPAAIPCIQPGLTSMPTSHYASDPTAETQTTESANSTAYGSTAQTGETTKSSTTGTISSKPPSQSSDQSTATATTASASSPASTSSGNYVELLRSLRTTYIAFFVWLLIS